MKHNFFKTILLLTGMMAVSCVKNEPLDIEGDYKKGIQERATEREAKEKEAQEKADEESKKAWDSYYKMLTEYKQKSWAGEKPFTYMFWSGWGAVEGLDKSWLQSIPDSITAISIWGGWGKEPEELTENQIFDIDRFHEKGSTIFTCYQVSEVGLGLPGGLEEFTKKYGREKSSEAETKRAKIYAREIARHIIALNFDGFDIDWEPTVGDHGSGYHEFAGGQGRVNSFTDNMITFFTELGKYFGAKYSGDERKQYLTELFNENNTEYHSAEKESIAKYKPYFEKYKAVDKKFDLIFDGQFFPMTEELDKYFDKYVMQDYGRVDQFSNYLVSPIIAVGGRSTYIPNNKRAASTAELEKGQFSLLIDKAKAYPTKNGGVSGYKGDFDYRSDVNTDDFANYLVKNKINGRKYKHYAYFREAIRIMDPRSAEEYKTYEEKIVIRTPKNPK